MFKDIETLHQELANCRRCADAGHQIESQPICSGPQSARLMIIGQAPGVSEGDLGYPFGGDAGRRLFQWLNRVGWDEQTFRQTCYITSVTKCFPGTNSKGSGDRVPSAAERELCAPWLEMELALIQPEVIVPVGRLAINLFYPARITMTDVIGESIQDEEGRQIVPFPHPSGASRWFNDARNLGRLERAIYKLRMLKLKLDL